MSIHYTGIPRAEVFKKDSSVTLAIRSKDTLIVAMDGLLEKMWGAPDDRFGMVVDLFLTINSWIKAFHEGSTSIEKGRYPAVAALNEVVCKELMSDLGLTSLSQLNRELHTLIGRDVTGHGAIADRSMHGLFFNDASREAKRLHFKGGRAYRYMADVPGKPKGLQLLDSQDFYNSNIVRDGARSMHGFAAFVMSMERDFYMARHYLGDASVFHSVYFGPGKKVAMAGTMLVKNGEVLGIRGDSGHYQPTPKQMANGIRALAALGVNIRALKVYSWDPKDTAFQTGVGASAKGFQQPARPIPSVPGGPAPYGHTPGSVPGGGGMQYVSPYNNYGNYGSNYNNANPGNYGNYGNYNNVGEAAMPAQDYVGYYNT